MGLFSKSKAVRVSTKSELESAIRRGEREIIVTGDIAQKLKKIKGISKLSSSAKKCIVTAVTVSGAAILSASFTGGGSAIVGISCVAPAVTAVATGLSVGTAQAIGIIIIAASLGAAIIIAVTRDYDIEASPGGGIILKKR